MEKSFWRLSLYTSSFRTSDVVYFGILMSFVHFLEQIVESGMFDKWPCSQRSAVGNMCFGVKSGREWLQKRSISVIFRFNSRFFIDVYGGLIEYCGCCLRRSWTTFRLAEVRRFEQRSHKSAQLLYGEYIQQWVTLYSKHQGWTQYRCKQYVTGMAM